MKTIVSLFISFLIFYSCEDSRTACLDLYASNYDFGAVNACDSCCKYPDFKVAFEFKYDSLSFNKDSVYVLMSGDSIQIKSVQIAFSNFIFQNSVEEYSIIDSIDFSGTTILDDYLLLRSTRSGSMTVGHTNYEAVISKLRFDIGFDDKFDETESLNNFDLDSQLKLSLDSMYVDSIAELRMFESTFVLEDSLRMINIKNEIIKDLTYDIQKTLAPGIDWQITLGLDYNILFSGTNSMMSNQELSNKIKENLITSITVN